MITGSHLNMGPLTSQDIEKEQGMSGGFKESLSNSKPHKPVTLRHGEGSKHHQRSQQQTDGEDSVETEAAYVADQQGSDYQQHETTRTTPIRSGSPGERRSEDSNRELDQARLLTRTIKSRSATGRNFECEKYTEEQE